MDELADAAIKEWRKQDEHDLIWTLLQAVGDAVDQGEGQASISGMRDALAHHGIRLLWVEPQTTFSA